MRDCPSTQGSVYVPGLCKYGLTECQDRIPPLLHSPNIRRQTPTTIGDTADVAYGADTRPSVEALPGAAESRRPAEDESVSPFA